MEKSKLRVLAEPILVGRERELRELQFLLDFAFEGKGRTAFVSGEAGTGKTRLINEFLNSAKRKRDVIIISGWCLSDAGVPYFPFKEAFKAYFSASATGDNLANISQSVVARSAEAELNKDEVAELKAWLYGPASSGAFTKLEGLAPQAWKDMTFAAVTRTLFSLSTRKPTILFIEDLHWADSASLALLHYISRVIAPQRILVLASFRSEELNIDGEGHLHPLVDTLRLMRRDNLFKEIKLGGLLPKDVLILAESMVGGRVQDSLARKLAEENQGNPLFVVESLNMLSERGSLIQENGKWSLSIEELALPTKIRDIVLRRAGMIKPDQRKILDVASVMGVKFNPELLGTILGLSNLEILEKLNSIALSSSLIVGDENSFMFDHATSREALFEDLSPPLRKSYHNMIADKSEESKGRKLTVSDLAYHYSQAGNSEKAMQFSLAAGEEALALFSGAEAIKHFKYVLKVVGEDQERAKERDTSLEGLGDSLYATGNLKEAAKVFEQLSCTANSNLIRLRSLRKALYVSHFLGDFSHSLETANKAMEIITENPHMDRLECARARLNKGMMERSTGNSANAIQDDEEAIRVFGEEYSLPDLVEGLPELAWAYADRGQLENALSQAIRAYTLSEYARSLDRQDVAILVLSLLFFFCGLRQEAQQTNAEEFRIADKITDPLSRWWNKAMSCKMSSALLETQATEEIFSQLHLENMKNYGTSTKIKFLLSNFNSSALRKFRRILENAVDQSLKGVDAAEETDSNHVLSISYSNLLRQYAQLGEKGEAEEYYKRMACIFGETSLKDYLFLRADWLASAAVFFSARHKWTEANRFYDECLEVRKRLGSANASDAAYRRSYGWTLLQQGRPAEAKIQFEEARKILNSLEKRFAHCLLCAYFVVPRKVEVGKQFNARLDIVNVARKSGSLVKVEGMFTSDFNVSATQPRLRVQGESVEMEKEIKPFQNQAITFNIHATKAGTFNLNPRVLYIDEAGESRICTIKPVRIKVEPKQINALQTGNLQTFASVSEPSTFEPRELAIQQQIGFEFKTEPAKKAFDYLIGSFVLDYMRRRLPLEWSGWRTLMEIVRNTQITKRSVYGEKNYRGRAISELEKRGLVEARVFPKERGRGGNILKVRVFYDRDVVKRQVDFRVGKSGKKETGDFAAK